MRDCRARGRRLRLGFVVIVVVELSGTRLAHRLADGPSTPAQVSWMNGVVSQFHKAYPAYAKTKVTVVWVATSFANLQGFFPAFTSQLKGGACSGNQVMSGFAKAATVTQISPLNAKNWATADTTDQIIPTMMKSLMQGANFTATVNKVNTQLQNVLNTGSES